MYHLRRITIFAICVAVLVFLIWLLPRLLIPVPPTAEERRRDRKWIDSSPYWLDRQACRWLSLCGVHHLRWDDPVMPRGNTSEPGEGGDLRLELRSSWEVEPERGWQAAGRIRRRAAEEIRGPGTVPKDIPDYVLAHAPLVHLYSDENFWPSDIAEHIQHTTAYADGSALNLTRPLSLRNLHELNWQGTKVCLTSRDDVEGRPEWLSNHAGVPSPLGDDGEDEEAPMQGGDPRLAEGTTWYDVDRDHPLRRISDPRKLRGGRLVSRPRRSKTLRRRTAGSQHPVGDDTTGPLTPHHKPDTSGYSRAPAVLVMVDKGSGILDAFWFFFYSYNLGQTVLNGRFGNHVGDWEHCMVRFENGIPRAMFLSEHEGGQAYAWSALEKHRPPDAEDGHGLAERPVVYSAVGSHAMYALPGVHSYVLPFKMLKDVTDKGPLWDPAKNNYAYFFDYVLDREEEESGAREHTSLTPAASNPGVATSWFHYAGAWGDETYSLGDERQWRLFGQYHYITGPQGPKFKNLDRSKVCQTPRCTLLFSLDAGRKAAWYN